MESLHNLPSPTTPPPNHHPHSTISISITTKNPSIFLYVVATIIEPACIDTSAQSSGLLCPYSHLAKPVSCIHSRNSLTWVKVWPRTIIATIFVGLGTLFGERLLYQSLEKNIG